MSDELYHVRAGYDKDCSRGACFLRENHLSTWSCFMVHPLTTVEA